VQDLLGTEADVRRQMERDPANQNPLSVALELQADCYAGVLVQARHADHGRHGQPIFTSLTDADIAQALDAAAAGR
jgi:predicted metalloprotease